MSAFWLRMAVSTSCTDLGGVDLMALEHPQQRIVAEVGGHGDEVAGIVGILDGA